MVVAYPFQRKRPPAARRGRSTAATESLVITGRVTAGPGRTRPRLSACPRPVRGYYSLSRIEDTTGSGRGPSECAGSGRFSQAPSFRPVGVTARPPRAVSRSEGGRLRPVSYTHLRAHET